MNTASAAAYDAERWHDLFVMAGGATAALAGLIFVAISVNHEQILRSAALPLVASRTLAVLIGAVFFRAPGVGPALDLLGGMIGLHGIRFSIPTEPKLQGKLALDVLWLVMLYAIVWAAPNTQEIMGEAQNRASSLAWRPSLPWAVGFGFAAAIGLLSIGGTGEFLYFQF